jgi:hypothetical protein
VEETYLVAFNLSHTHKEEKISSHHQQKTGEKRWELERAFTLHKSIIEFLQINSRPCSLLDEP